MVCKDSEAYLVRNLVVNCFFFVVKDPDVDLPPHIYALTDNMYRNMMIERESQCVIIRYLEPCRSDVTGNKH